MGKEVIFLGSGKNGLFRGKFTEILGENFTEKLFPQYELDSFVTMATYWAPDLPNIKSLSSHLWHYISIFANGDLYALSSKHTCLHWNYYHVNSSSGTYLTALELKITKILKSSGWELAKCKLPWEHCLLLQYVCCPKNY